jgi:hypothetical protein
MFSWACRGGHADIVRLLLDRPRVKLSLEHVCIACVRGHDTVIREFFNTVWLDFSSRALAHLENNCATKSCVKIVREHPRYRGGSQWIDTCLNGVQYHRLNSCALSIAWCMQQMTGSWPDMTELLIARTPVVVLRVDDEGPILGLSVLPNKPRLFWERLALSVALILLNYILVFNYSIINTSLVVRATRIPW